MGRFSIDQAILDLDWEVANRVQMNINALRSTMSLRYNVGVRDDSRLAYNWAIGTVRAPIEEIMEELAFIQWLSSHTNYQQVCEDGLRSIANDIKFKYPDISWSKVWTIVRGIGPDLIKYTLVDKYSAGVPDLTKINA
ncbi:hypothetical protein EOVG_00161 [Emiliania huxleyi virus 88]|nr:hypothetical protein EOVG_00161 [Emiliania huxleyi virus 88]